MDLYIEDKLCTFLGSDVPCDLQVSNIHTLENDLI
jgi:hypothetical protein